MMETDTICPVYTITSQILRYNKEYILSLIHILIYDKTRLLIHDDLFMEFQMLCEQKQIIIIDLQDFRNPLAAELMLCL